MDDATKHQTDEAPSRQALIDIFYKDTYRLNSLISQINNGALQSVTTTTDNAQGSISTCKGEVGIPKLVNAEGARNISESITQSIRQTKNSLDDAVLQLLQNLSLSPEFTLPHKIFSNLCIVCGEIYLTNYKVLAEFIPLLKDLAPIFDPALSEKQDLEERITALKSKPKKTHEEKDLLRDQERLLSQLKRRLKSQTDMYKNIHVILPLLPKGIGLGIYLEDGSVFTGNLKPEYLIDTEESISMNYGEKLPDKWNILGIVDYKEEVTDDDAKNPLIDLLHQTKEMRHLLGISNNQGTVIPLLIYRELNIPSPV